MVAEDILNEWIEKCKSKSRKANIVILRNAIINYLFFNVEATQKDIAKFLNFDRSTISVVTRQHHNYKKNKMYKEVYEVLFNLNLKEIYLNFLSESK